MIRSLADAYGISATPVREALHWLVAKRLLTMLPNRSVVVPELTCADLVELTRIRAALEGLCAELATPLIVPIDMKRLHGLIYDLQVAIDRQDIRSYVSLNQKLHFAIYERAGAPRLFAMIQDLWSQIGPFLNTLFACDAYAGAANDEHRRIIAAIEDNDAERVRQYVMADIRSAAQALTGSLSVA